MGVVKFSLYWLISLSVYPFSFYQRFPPGLYSIDILILNKMSLIISLDICVSCLTPPSPSDGHRGGRGDVLPVHCPRAGVVLQRVRPDPDWHVITPLNEVSPNKVTPNKAPPGMISVQRVCSDPDPGIDWHVIAPKESHPNEVPRDDFDDQ